MNDIFVSYRRADSSDVTGRIFDHLKSRYGEDRLFKDVDSIPLGDDFRHVISDAVGRCNVLLAVIGNDWLDVQTDTGKRRIDDPDDYVHIEISTALERSIPVIPVLVENTPPPSETDLPEPLRELAYRNAAQVRADPDFQHDVARLCTQLDAHIGFNHKPYRRYYALASIVFVLVIGVGGWIASGRFFDFSTRPVVVGADNQREQRVALALIQSLGGQVREVEDRITDVTLGATITDGELSRLSEHLERQNDLELLNLRGANITDMGLKHLYGLGQLKRVLLDESGVSYAGVADLRSRLPGCQIEWDADFNTAKFVLARGGTVWTKKDGRYILDVATVNALSDVPFAVTSISFRSNRAVNDNDLRRLSGLTHLESLHLDETYVTDHGLAYLAKLTTLKTLTLEDVSFGGLGGR
jgi:hypothetical protein